MKFFIVFLALTAVAVNAQSRLDPFSNNFSKNYYSPQNAQPIYQPFVPIVTTTAPDTFSPYNAPYIDSQPYSPYETSTTTRRPYIPVVTNSASATFPPDKAAYIGEDPYSLYQNSTTTRHPYFPFITNPAQRTFQSYKIGPENTQPDYQPYRSYQTSTTTHRPYIPVDINPAPPTFQTYNTRPQNVQPEYQPYRPYQTSTTTRRPYISIVTNSAPTTFPLYNTRPQNAQSEYEPYRPYQTLTTTRRPYFPIDTGLAPTTRQPYIPPRFVAPATKYYNDDVRSASTVKSGNEINSNGNYNWFFETDNGITARAQGIPRNFGGNPPLIVNAVEGAFSWIAPNGELIEFTYTADENGYHPKSNAIPTTPPIPRALEYVSRGAAAKK